MLVPAARRCARSLHLLCMRELQLQLLDVHCVPVTARTGLQRLVFMTPCDPYTMTLCH